MFIVVKYIIFITGFFSLKLFISMKNLDNKVHVNYIIHWSDNFQMIISFKIKTEPNFLGRKWLLECNEN